MDKVVITVRGSHERRVAAELATVQVFAQADGSHREEVLHATTQYADAVRRSLAEANPEEWSAGGIAVHSDRPWSHDGKQLDPVHYARANFTVTFRDLDGFSLWASSLSALDGIELTAVRWLLTPQTRSRVEKEVAGAAIADAVERAEAYAAGLGLTQVQIVELADIGLLSGGESPPSHMMGTRVMHAESGSPATFAEPELIPVRLDVEARFHASGAGTGPLG